MNRLIVFLILLFFSGVTSSAEDLYFKAFQSISKNRTEEAINTIKKSMIETKLSMKDQVQV